MVVYAGKKKRYIVSVTDEKGGQSKYLVSAKDRRSAISNVVVNLTKINDICSVELEEVDINKLVDSRTWVNYS